MGVNISTIPRRADALEATPDLDVPGVAREFAKRVTGLGEKFATDSRDAIEKATTTIENTAVSSIREVGRVSQAVIGGLADWYAVVALFRRPLGLPIPHTAIIPSNQQLIAEKLGEFIEEEFLDAAPVEAKLNQTDFASFFSDWLDDRKRMFLEGCVITRPTLCGVAACATPASDVHRTQPTRRRQQRTARHIPYLQEWANGHPAGPNPFRRKAVSQLVMARRLRPTAASRAEFTLHPRPHWSSSVAHPAL